MADVIEDMDITLNSTAARYSSPWHIPLAVVLLLVFRFVGSVVYRLWLSPLAHIPGPRLAACTSWYETYYQLFKGEGGRYTFKIAEWHRKYGPIVRVGPNDIHFSDPEYFDTIYTHSQGIDKPAYFKHLFGSPGATFSAVPHDLHRIRKASLLPFFSKKKILELEDSIQAHINRMCERLKTEYQGKGKVLNLGDMLSCFTADVATIYAFDRTYNWLDYPDFISPFTAAINAFKSGGHLAIQFPLLARFMSIIPDSIMVRLMPTSKPIINFKGEIRRQVLDILSNRTKAIDEREQGTIFTNLINSDLPSSQLTLERLTDEGSGVVGAGIETTKWSTVVTFFYILNNPMILKELRNELRAAFPNPNSIMTVSELEKLPYLMACIEEGLRLSYGGVARSPRIFRKKTLQYGPYIIPPGTAVSTDAWAMHHNEDLFPDSFTFDPKRWLSQPDNVTVEGSAAVRGKGKKNLRSYLNSFGKGTRICLGMQLAYAEMELLLAYLFRSFDFEFFETDETDVLCVRDEIAPAVKSTSKGVRLKVHAREME